MVHPLFGDGICTLFHWLCPHLNLLKQASKSLYLWACCLAYWYLFCQKFSHGNTGGSGWQSWLRNYHTAYLRYKPGRPWICRPQKTHHRWPSKTISTADSSIIIFHIGHMWITVKVQALTPPLNAEPSVLCTIWLNVSWYCRLSFPEKYTTGCLNYASLQREQRWIKSETYSRKARFIYSQLNIRIGSANSPW